MRSFARTPQITVCLGLISIGMGLLFIFSACNWIDFLKTRDWVETPATLLRVDLTDSTKSGEEPEPKSLFGAFGKRLEVDYRYEFDGAVYHGSLAGLESFETSATRTRRYEFLQGVLEHGGGLTIRVHPDRPGNAAIFREETHGMILFPFTAILWFLTIFLVRRRRVQRVPSASRDGRFMEARNSPLQSAS